jgi:hypothetical protein
MEGGPPRGPAQDNAGVGPAAPAGPRVVIGGA